MINLMLCVNDSNGNVTDQCLGLEVWIDDTEAAIELECELSFLEIPDGLIQIENAVYPYTSRATMVGNVFWNQYQLAEADVIALCNRLKFSPVHNLLAAWTPLWDKWESAELFDADDFKVEAD